MDPLLQAKLCADAQHDAIFPKPSDPERTVLWRYLSTDPDDIKRGKVDKFDSLIKSSSLYLTKASTLDDTLEGRSNEVSRLEKRNFMEQSMYYYDEHEDTQNEEELRDYVFVNCWHRNDAESIPMWSEYCGLKQGVVLRTTFAKLENACEPDLERKFFAGCIRYFDPLCHSIPPGSPLLPFMHKDRKFRFENEVRVATLRENADHHVEMHLNLSDLIDGIYVHPLALTEYFQGVKLILQEFEPSLLSRLHWSQLKGRTSLSDFMLSGEAC